MIAARCRSDSIPPTNTPKRNNTMKKTEGQEIEGEGRITQLNRTRGGAAAVRFTRWLRLRLKK